MRKVAILAMALLAMAQLAVAVELTGTYADIKTQAAGLNKPILIDFYADW